MTQFVARIVAFDGDRAVLPDVERLKLIDISPAGMAETEAYLDDVLEQLVEEDGVRPHARHYRLQVLRHDTGAPVMYWRYTRTGR